jgi:hypothetical protein
MFENMYNNYNIKKNFNQQQNSQILEVMKEDPISTSLYQMDNIREYLSKKKIDDISLILDAQNGQGKLYLGTIQAALDGALLKDLRIRSVLTVMANSGI